MIVHVQLNGASTRLYERSVFCQNNSSPSDIHIVYVIIPSVMFPTFTEDIYISICIFIYEILYRLLCHNIFCCRCGKE